MVATANDAYATDGNQPRIFVFDENLVEYIPIFQFYGEFVYLPVCFAFIHSMQVCAVQCRFFSFT